MSLLQQALDYLGWRNDELDGEQVDPDEYEDLGGFETTALPRASGGMMKLVKW